MNLNSMFQSPLQEDTLKESLKEMTGGLLNDNQMETMGTAAIAGVAGAFAGQMLNQVQLNTPDETQQLQQQFAADQYNKHMPRYEFSKQNNVQKSLRIDD